MSTFERYLTLWVALCIVVGVALGHLLPGVFSVIGSAEIAKVNLPVAALIWLMIVPMLIRIDFAARDRHRCFCCRCCAGADAGGSALGAAARRPTRVSSRTAG